MKGYWEELVQFLPIPYCICGGLMNRTESCLTEVTVKKYRENEVVTRFIYGLNDAYGGVRTNLFMMSPLPSMETTFHYAIQHERQIARPLQESQVESVALLASNQFKRKEVVKGILFCRYCKKDNHVIADCFKLKKKNKESGSSSSFVGQLQGVESLGGGILPNPETRSVSEQVDGFTHVRLCTEDLSRLQKLFSQPSPPPSPTSPVAAGPNFNSPHQQQQPMVNSFTRHLSMNPNFAEAIKEECWKQAMDSELQALDANITWIVVPHPPDPRTIENLWVFTIKFNSDGSVARYKARFVAKGFTQIYGVDFLDTDSPVAKLNSKTLLALAAAKNWELFQLDVSNIYGLTPWHSSTLLCLSPQEVLIWFKAGFSSMVL